MSIFDEVNPNSLSIGQENTSFGPTVGFYEGFQIAHDAHARASSIGGLSYYFEKEDEEQATRWSQTRDGTRVPRLRDVADYDLLANHFVDGAPLTAEQRSKLDRYDKSVNDSRKLGLKLRSSGELFKSVQDKARTAERDLLMSPTTLGGDVGEFVGGMAAAVDPRTDLFNFLTLPVGGAGKTIATRVGSQVGAQGFIETINQVTGVQESRRLLGLDHGFANAATQVVGTAAGAGVIQGVGELVAKGARSFFASPNAKGAATDNLTPDLEAPIPPSRERSTAADVGNSVDEFLASLPERSPNGVKAGGPGLTTKDLDDVTALLDDWGGPKPWQMTPNTHTAASRFGSDSRPDITYDISTRVDSTARQIDPETFRRYDRYAGYKRAAKANIEELKGGRDEAAAEAVEDLSDEITRLEARMHRVGARTQAQYRKRIADMQAERADTLARITSSDTPEMAQQRARLMRADERMRDLAPQVSRAYARARDKWAPAEKDLESVISMIRDGKTDIGRSDVVGADPVPTPATEPLDRLISSAPPVEGVRPEAPKSEKARGAIAEHRKQVDDASLEFRTALDGLEIDETGEVRLQGYEDRPLHADNDTIVVEGPDGSPKTLTVRQLLKEASDDEAELRAFTACSTNKAT